jgi:hypothetical protein
MTRGQSVRFAILALAIWALVLCVTPTSRPRAEALPQRLDNRTFWSLVTDFSEPGGSFRSDNLVSNELSFEQVIPRLQQQVTPMSAYVGVGPDQNFTYIAALEPRIAFIVDIRRQNMLLQLMYKALIEMSPTRLEFATRLFSRQPRTDVAASASPDELLAAFQSVEPSGAAFTRTQQDIHQALLGNHGFTFVPGDLAGIDYVFGAFYRDGPDIRYSIGRGPGWQPFPSFRDLMIEHDLDGVQHSYLSSEQAYQTLRDMEQRNLIVPLVGDFAGPKALRSVGRYLDLHHATVSVFYTSNVEQYLFRGDLYQRFYANVAALPIDARSTFIRAYFLNQGRVYRPDPGQPGPIGPRSEQLLNPIQVLLAAFDEGRISSYFDVIDLSRQ